MAHANLKKFSIAGAHREGGFSMVEVLVSAGVLIAISGVAVTKLKLAANAVAAESSGQSFTSLSSAFRGEAANKVKLFVGKYAAGTLKEKDLPAAMASSSATLSGLSYSLVSKSNLIAGGDFPMGSDAAAAKSRCNTKSPTFTGSSLYLCVNWKLPTDASKSFGNLVNGDKPVFVEMLFTMHDTTNFKPLTFTAYDSNDNAGGRIFFGMSWAPKNAGKSTDSDKVDVTSKTFSGIQYVTK